MSIWAIKAGEKGYAVNFAKENKIAGIHFFEQDISTLQTEEEYRKLISEKQLYNDRRQVWKLKSEVRKGDYIIIPNTKNSTLIIGIVETEYQYNADYIEYAMCHYVKLRDIKEISKSLFSLSLLNSINTLLALSQIKQSEKEKEVIEMYKKYDERQSDNILEALLKEKNAEEDVGVLDTEAEIQKYILAQIEPHEFTELIAELLKTQGFITEKEIVKSSDGNCDILAGKGSLGLEHSRIVVQVKRTIKPHGIEEIERFANTVEKFKADYGLFASLGGFTSDLHKKLSYRQLYFKVKLWDTEDIIAILQENYDKLSDNWRKKIPLKKVTILDRENIKSLLS